MHRGIDEQEAWGTFEGMSNTLTARQQQVLDLWLAGNTYRELAHTLGISPETVNPHLKAIARKLGIKGIARDKLRVSIEDASRVGSESQPPSMPGAGSELSS